MGTLVSLSRDSTQHWLHASEWVVLIAGIILGIGITGEINTNDRLPIFFRRIKAFELLVLIGVMGELLGDGGVFLFSERLQERSDSRLRSTTERLIKAEALSISTGTLLLRTVKESAPRTLTIEQQARIVSKIKPFSNTPFDLSVDPEPEALALLDIVDSILVSSGWLNFPPQVKPGQFFSHSEMDTKLQLYIFLK
jgi:hypothetical protein